MRYSATGWTSTALVLAAVGVAACGLSGGNPEPVAITRASYQPFGASYRGVSVGRTTQHFDDQPTATDFGFEYFVTVDVIAAAEGMAATLVLDSVLLFDEATAGLSQDQVDLARGTAFTATMASNGRLTDFAGGEDAGQLAMELAGRVLKPFFPILPPRGAESGAVWSDTVNTQMVVNGLGNDIHLVSQHSATDWTLHGGERALHILTVSDYSFSGSGSQAGRAFTIDGTGRRHIHRYVSEAGRYLGMISADTSNAEARITDMEMVIPIRQTRIDSLVTR